MRIMYRGYESHQVHAVCAVCARGRKPGYEFFQHAIPVIRCKVFGWEKVFNDIPETEQGQHTHAAILSAYFPIPEFTGEIRIIDIVFQKNIMPIPLIPVLQDMV